MLVLLALLSCVGLTFILKYGSILSLPRGLLIKIPLFRDLFQCSLCLGFWSGFVVAGGVYFIKWDPSLFLLPLASAALSWASDSSLRLIQTIELSLDKYIDKK